MRTHTSKQDQKTSSPPFLPFSLCHWSRFLAVQYSPASVHWSSFCLSDRWVTCWEFILSLSSLDSRVIMRIGSPSPAKLLWCLLHSRLSNGFCPITNFTFVHFYLSGDYYGAYKLVFVVVTLILCLNNWNNYGIREQIFRHIILKRNLCFYF